MIIYISYNNINMRNQLVKIDAKRGQGLILKWNYIDLSKKNIYFHHIITILTSQLQQAQHTLTKYLKHMKMGDLFTVIYAKDETTVKVLQWREKTNRFNFNKQEYLNQKQYFYLSFERAVEAIEKQIELIAGPTIINFITSEQKNILNIKNKIKLKRIDNKFKFISTIFSPSNINRMSVADGIHLLNYKDPYIYEFYHNQLNQMALEKAHLTISSKNGLISSFYQDAWHNTAFNKIERDYYGPSASYKQDILHLFNKRIFQSGVYDLQFHLQFKYFDGRTYTSQKSILLHFHYKDFNCKTIYGNKPRTYYEIQNVQLELNPFQSQQIIYFTKNPQIPQMRITGQY